MLARFLYLTLAIILLSGCAGYSTQDWPDLSEGFEGAYTERGATYEQPDRISDLEQPTSDVPDTLAINALQEGFSNIQARISAQREAYERASRQARVEAESDNENINWLSAQLELTRLSQLAEELLVLSDQVGSLIGSAAGTLFMAEISEFRNSLDQYIVAERNQLADLT